MVMDIREATKITILIEDDYGGTVFRTARGHYITVADEIMSVIVPGEVLEKFKTRFFRIDERQGEIILTPAKVQLELVENDESKFGSPRVEKKSVLGENLGGREDLPKLKQLGGI